ncbi:unnamed protein product [Mytilus edulis]|uniref:Uncharacterized protein n=1 Tax=Mytilus edulis TaxID=6550 RepID=A0A8S3TR99_MYTED|nr:unnamed protein product [Mytilus edulis]
MQPSVTTFFDKDVPCAVCRVIHSTSVIMIPGKASCHKGWNMEYKGLLASGNRFDNGASTYICIDQIPDVLEGGVQDDNGYILFLSRIFVDLSRDLRCNLNEKEIHSTPITLKSAMENIKQTVVSKSTLIQKQKIKIANLQIKTAEIATLKTKLQQQTIKIANLQIQTAEIATLKTKLQQPTTELANLQITKSAEVANLQN